MGILKSVPEHTHDDDDDDYEYGDDDDDNVRDDQDEWTSCIKGDCIFSLLFDNEEMCKYWTIA